MTTSSKIATANSKRPSIRRNPSSENASAISTENKPIFLSSSFGRALVKRIQNHDFQNKLLIKGSSILVACSGGPDSVALLHIFLSLRDKLSLRLGVAHVNYRIRKADADKDELLVRHSCAEYGIPFFVLHPKNAVGKNEEALRDIRYSFFEQIRKREKFDAIAVAHTEDDQAETVLIRLLRGSGPDGLAAMRPRNGHIIRPFLDIPKNDILRFLRDEQIPFHTDTTNNDTSILRNRIRHKLLPLLEQDYQPGIRKILARTARIFEENTLSERLEAPILPYANIRLGILFLRSDYMRFPAQVQASELRRLYRIVSKTGSNPAESFVREIEKLIGSTKGKIRTYVSGQLKIEVKGDKVTMIRNK
ncbi:MAG: tRNA lysidine(34) synthetase TilS [Candidatus Moraniibacteriota bacterium]